MKGTGKHTNHKKCERNPSLYRMMYSEKQKREYHTVMAKQPESEVKKNEYRSENGKDWNGSSNLP